MTERITRSSDDQQQRPTTPTQPTQPTQTPSDEELRKLLKPNPTHEQILSALKRSFFPERCDLIIQKELDSYDDRNYVIEYSTFGEKYLYLLKVHNGVESQDFIDAMNGSDFFNCSPNSIIHLQHAMLQHLNAKDIPVHISEVLYEWDWDISKPPPFFIESLPVVSPDYSPRELALRVYRWLPGQPMSSVPMLPIETLADAGCLLGRMDQQLDAFDGNKYGAAKRFHQWDTKHTTCLRKFTKYIANPNRRQLVESIIDAFQSKIIDSGLASTFRIGINHGDFNDANILIGKDYKVSGVIDFGDSVESWRVLEISVALAYAFLSVYAKPGRSLAAAAAMLRGYHLVYPLKDVERQHLHLLAACRLACSVTLGAYSYQQNPGNEYLLFHAEPAWKALEMLWGNGDPMERERVSDVVQALFDQACVCQPEQHLDVTGNKGEQRVIDCTDLSYPDAYWLSGAGAFHSLPTKIQKVYDDQQQPPLLQSDEELRKFLKPNPTHEQIVAAMKRSTFFDCHSDVRVVKEFDLPDGCRNYVLRRESSLFILTVHNGVESKELIGVMKDSDFFKCSPSSIIHFQHAVLEHLANKCCPVPSPMDDPLWHSLKPSSQPAPFVIESLPVCSLEQSPSDLVLRLFHWRQCEPMSSFPMIPIESLADAGRVLGLIDQGLDDFDASKYNAAKGFHPWDLKHTSNLFNFTYCIANSHRRQLVERIIDEFQSQIIDSGAAAMFRLGINHGDFNEDNIFINESFNVTGVTGFGNSVESWRVLDIAVALADSLLSVYGKGGRSLSAAAAMLRGYHSVYPLMDDERQHLHLLIACRLACIATLDTYSFQQDPGDHKQWRTELAWEALEMMWGNSNSPKRESVVQVVNMLFDQACAYRPKEGGGTDQNAVIYCTDLGYPDAYWLSAESNSDLVRPGKKQKVFANESTPFVTFVTGNKKKLEEVVRIMGQDLPCEIGNLGIDLPELQGEPDQICRKKCALAAEKVGASGRAVITEDTSLCCNALNGLPGPYIKWFLDKCGLDGLNRMLAGWEDKSAYALTIVGFCAGPGQEVFTFEGRTDGNIVPARGNSEFGWDPVFEPLEGGGQKTYAEMSTEEKDAISHRSRALLKLKSFLMERYATSKP